MIGGDEFGAAEVEPFAAEARNSLRGLQQRLRRASTEGADHFGTDHVELAHQERRARGDFVLFRQAIFGRAAFHHVADVDISALESHGFDHLREQFAGAADEWLALNIFIVARAFADEDEIGFRIAHTEHELGAALVQLAARAIVADGFLDELQRIVLDAFFEQRCAGWDLNERLCRRFRGCGGRLIFAWHSDGRHLGARSFYLCCRLKGG